ncbi:MAG: HYR domain-containing protein [Opitutae bacterium]|nr:HYR domain-containing protein [Opitutae bacterium]
MHTIHKMKPRSPSRLSRLGQRMLSSMSALLPALVLTPLAVPSVRADVVFTRSTQTGEAWAHYTATFTPTYSGNYTLGFNLTAGGPSGDNSILIDAVTVTTGATNVFSDGFETPDLGNNTGISAGSGSATIGNWVCTNSSGILDGSPPNWGLSGQGLGFADGTRQYGFLQKYNASLPNIKAANTLALVAGQTYTVSFYQASRRDFGGTTTYTVTLDAPPPVTVFASGISPVIAWDPIYPAAAISPWESESKPVPTVGYDANWVNPHPASVFPVGTHPWEFIAPMDFAANWINAWPNITSQGPAGQSWTKYSTTVTGEGDFVLQFLADNASWIYIDGNLIGYQDQDWGHNSTGRYTIHLSGAGPHELSFLIWDGGGAAGGKFRLETTQSFLDNNPGEELPPPPPPSDATPPVISAPADITTEATGPDGAVVSFTATANDNVDGPVSVLANPASGSTFPLGSTTVALGAGDAAGNIATTSFTVTVVDTTPPVITPPADIVAEATSAAGANVTFTVANATDLVSGSVPVVAAPASGGTFPLGVSTVALGASDAAGNAATSSFTVTVRDTTAPVIASVTPSIRSIWPPNKKMVPVTISVGANDAVGVASSRIVSVATNQPDSRTQWQITGPLTVNLLADRRGDDKDRIYTITVEVRDAAGNVSIGTTTVTVPHDQRNKDRDDEDDDDRHDKDKGRDKDHKKG